MMKRETNGLLMDFRVELLVYNNKINNLSYFLYRYNVYSLNESSSIWYIKEYSNSLNKLKEIIESDNF